MSCTSQVYAGTLRERRCHGESTAKSRPVGGAACRMPAARVLSRRAASARRRWRLSGRARCRRCVNCGFQRSVPRHGDSRTHGGRRALLSARRRAACDGHRSSSTCHRSTSPLTPERADSGRRHGDEVVGCGSQVVSNSLALNFPFSNTPPCDLPSFPSFHPFSPPTSPPSLLCPPSSRLPGRSIALAVPDAWYNRPVRGRW